MKKHAIRVQGLSKQYTLGARRESYRTLREALSGALSAPFKHLRSPLSVPYVDSKIWALRDVNFDVERGETVGIIGRNGAGKSTLLKVLSRITEPTAGHLAVRGRIASLLEVGTGFHPELTGRENVFLNGAILGMTRAEVRRRFDEIVAFADVERFIDTPVKHYSSGMYMRLAFAIAAHLETDILMIDEVLAVGDASFQQKCLAKMEDVAGHGRTVLFVSHNMTAVQSLCRRVISFENGQVKGDGDPKEQVRSYLSSTAQQEPYKRVSVGNAFIVSVVFQPNPIETGSDLQFEVDLAANCPTRLSEVVLLIYAAEGPRVGIVDLRGAGFPFSMGTGDRIRVSGVIKTIPLVENHYRIGLGIDSGAFVGDVKDVANLIVSFQGGEANFSPYRPEVRGWVEFMVERLSASKQDPPLAKREIVAS